MSNLNRPYEISVWDDILEGEEFVEKRLGVIGSNEMLSQSRALNSQLGRNVNGTRTFQFEMYHYYIDNVTGKRIENPFVGWLVSERKVKLHYKNKWYDFIIKDIEENSQTYLCKYKLEDANVQELSKNGFGVTLDEKMSNNLGNPETLANIVLADTDWKVQSEIFVQTVEESLVWVTIPSGQKIIHLLDQDTNSTEGLQKGVTVDSKTPSLETDGNEHQVLAFYSSCTGKPHRFQFIYLPDFDKSDEELEAEKIFNYGITKDKNGRVKNQNCQYYIEFEPTDYPKNIDDDGFYLPNNFTLFRRGDGYLYTGARGNKYSFSHQTIYSPTLDRYIYKYHKWNKETERFEVDENGKRKEFYGYYDIECYSPTLIQNFVTNPNFDSTTGWIGTKSNKDDTAATVRNVYGYFDGDKFIDTADQLIDGTFNPNNTELASYLEIKLEDANSLVINSGPYDNRITIKNMEYGSQWMIYSDIYDSQGESTSSLNITLAEYTYNSGDDCYSTPTDPRITFDQDGSLYTVTDTTFTKDTFKNDSQVRIGISGAVGTYYIKTFEFFRYVVYKEEAGVKKYIRPNDYSTQSDLLEKNVVKNFYKYFSAEQLKKATSQDDLEFELETEELSYTTYVPVYNDGAEKIRSVSAKESNYFNILQSIAETFGAWLEIDVEHNSDGSIKIIEETKQDKNGIETSVKRKAKWARFKNYVGKNNYANFRYGVNLKDIQRTYASKEIVTKLMVKPNSNQHANNGMCAIGRADANPTKEDYIYDFRYFNDRGMLNSDRYLSDVYVLEDNCLVDMPDNWIDQYVNKKLDIDSVKEINQYYNSTDGYYIKIKELNNKITHISNDIIIPMQEELVRLESNYAVAEAGYKSATENIRKSKENFKKLTGIAITDHIKNIKEVKIDSTNAYGQYDQSGHINYIESDYWEVTSVSKKINVGDNSEIYVAIEFKKKKGDVPSFGPELVITLNPIITTDSSSNTVQIFTLTIDNEKDDDYDNNTFPTEENTWSKKTPDDGYEYATKTFTVVIDSLIGNSTSKREKLAEYATFIDNEKTYKGQMVSLQVEIKNKTSELNKQNLVLSQLKEWKSSLNLAFFSKYSRFIQEGTWIDEKYSDDNLYYADALSVMFNSCYPKVAYTINTIVVNSLPGYEGFVFELGDSTYVEDAEFFENEKEEVVITELIEFLNEPDKDQIKVQNFKNQFQDLFQKITATVQQAQYSTGSYEKAVALAEASQSRKQQFLTDALSGINSKLTTAGQQSVVWGNDGITITDLSKPSEQIRMIGGAILLKGQDENGEEIWTTGITAEGMSANLIRTGILNANEISIMNGKDPVFRWDAFGISAYDYLVSGTGQDAVISGINQNKFVRFDKYGVYGINGLADGSSWHPKNIDDIDKLATFSLTWEGLKVVGSQGGALRLGKNAGTLQLKNSKGEPEKRPLIMQLLNNEDDITFGLTEEGNAYFKGKIDATQGTIGGWHIDENDLYSKTIDKDGKVVSQIGLTTNGGKVGENSTIKFYAGTGTEVPQWHEEALERKWGKQTADSKKIPYNFEFQVQDKKDELHHQMKITDYTEEYNLSHASTTYTDTILTEFDVYNDLIMGLQKASSKDDHKPRVEPQMSSGDLVIDEDTLFTDFFVLNDYYYVELDNSYIEHDKYIVKLTSTDSGMTFDQVTATGNKPAPFAFGKRANWYAYATVASGQSGKELAQRLTFYRIERGSVAKTIQVSSGRYQPGLSQSICTANEKNLNPMDIVKHSNEHVLAVTYSGKVTQYPSDINVTIQGCDNGQITFTPTYNISQNSSKTNVVTITYKQSVYDRKVYTVKISMGAWELWTHRDETIQFTIKSTQTISSFTDVFQLKARNQWIIKKYDEKVYPQWPITTNISFAENPDATKCLISCYESDNMIPSNCQVYFNIVHNIKINASTPYSLSIADDGTLNAYKANIVGTINASTLTQKLTEKVAWGKSFDYPGDDTKAAMPLFFFTLSDSLYALYAIIQTSNTAAANSNVKEETVSLKIKQLTTLDNWPSEET